LSPRSPEPIELLDATLAGAGFNAVRSLEVDDMLSVRPLRLSRIEPVAAI
jgi:hypothetical protein